MSSSDFFYDLGILTGLAGLVFAIKASFRASRSPRRPTTDPLLPELVAASLLIGVCNLCGIFDRPVVAAWSWPLAGHLIAALVFFGVAARSMRRSWHRGADSKH